MSQLGLFESAPPPPRQVAQRQQQRLGPLTNRYYQDEAIEAILEAFKTHNRALLVMATGLGKTHTFVSLASQCPGRVLIIVHRDELAQQASDAIRNQLGLDVGIEKASSHADLECHQVVVASIQTLLKRKERFPPDHFMLVVLDETHRYMAKQWKTAVDYFGDTGTKILGVTATPDRGDRKSLGKLFDVVAYQMDILDGMDSGFLVPFVGQTAVVESINVDQVRVIKGDLAAGELDEEVVKGVEGIVQSVRKLHPDRTAIAFFPGVKSAELAAERFNVEVPGSACFISGKTPTEERRDIVKRFRAGEYQYLCNCGVATEGFDAPIVDLIILARPTKSRALLAQMAGRGGRVLPGTIDGLNQRNEAVLRRQCIALSEKPDCILLDFVGNSKHSLVGPADILGGDYTEAERKVANKQMKKKGGEIRETLRAARRELQALANATKSDQLKLRTGAYDPFASIGFKAPEPRHDQKPATFQQREVLKKLGVADKDREALSYTGARNLLKHFTARRKQGLCSYKQAKQLKRFGIDPEKVSFHTASACLDYAFSRPRNQVDPKVMKHIITKETNK